MESAQEQIVVFTKIKQIDERFHTEYHSGFGQTAEFNKVSLGWYVWFHGSHELLHVGNTKPQSWNVGDTVKITFTKEPPCPPSQTITPPNSSSSSSSGTPSPAKPDR